MANDANKIKSEFDFHPCDTPRGMLYYNLSELTTEQQLLLNEHKLDVIRDNQQYLSEHPEIKVVTSVILKAILRERPKVHVQEYLAKYLTESWQDIKTAIDKCIAEKELKVPMPSASSILKALRLEEPEEASLEEEYKPAEDIPKFLPEPTQVMCRNILDNLIEELVNTEEQKESKSAATTPHHHRGSGLSLQSFIRFPEHFSLQNLNF